MHVETPKNIFPLPDFSNAPPLSDENLQAHISELEHSSMVNLSNILPLIYFLPESYRTKPVVSFICYTFATKGVGLERHRKQENVLELIDDISRAYDIVSGSTVGTIVQRTQDTFLYPEDKSVPPVTLSRYQGSGTDGWINSIEKGLVLGFFVLEDDQNTVVLHSQVQELFFTPAE